MICHNRIRSLVTVVSILLAPPFLPTDNASFPVVDAEGSSAFGAVSSAFSALKNLDSRYFIAGGTCAAISHGVTTPIDVIKTKIQSDPTRYNKGMVQTAIDICKTDGPAVLVAGLGPTVVGYGIEGAMKFGIYEVMKSVLIELFGANNKALAYIIASIVAGSVAAVLLCPMESARIKIVTDPSYSGLGFHKCLTKMISDEGLFASFSGVYAMLSKQVPYTFGKQVSFDVFATLLYSFFHTIQAKFPLAESNVKWMVSFLAAFFASLVACISSQPGDMILTETFHKHDDHKDHKLPVSTISAHSTETTTNEVYTSISQERLQPAFVGVSSSGTTPESPAFVPSNAAAFETVPTDEGLIATSSARADVQQHRSFKEVIQCIYDKGGIPAFFTGTNARIVHVGLIITTQLVVYDIVKQLLGLPATGSH